MLTVFFILAVLVLVLTTAKPICGGCVGSSAYDHTCENCEAWISEVRAHDEWYIAQLLGDVRPDDLWHEVDPDDMPF